MKWHQTSNRGLRYREHARRRHGLHKDRYYQIRWQKDGKRYEESLGWESQGWTVDKAVKELQALRENAVKGEGPLTLKEKRAIEQQRRERERVRKITFGKFFEDVYVDAVDKKPNAVRTEQLLYDHFIKPVIGNVPLADVTELHLQKIKQGMAEKAPATVVHALGLIRQVFNVARRRNVFVGDNPVSKVKMPKIDNARLRYLSPDEARVLLEALKEKSEQVADESMLALNCGLRFGEIAGMKGSDVNFETGTLSIRDAKAGSRVAFMNPVVEAMLRRRTAITGRGLVFPGRDGERQGSVSKTFQRVAKDLFNKDVKDRRLRVSFHSLRHTFASWLYAESRDLYLVQKALGHATMTMAQRYAKLSEPRLRDAFQMVGEVATNVKPASTAIVRKIAAKTTRRK